MQKNSAWFVRHLSKNLREFELCSKVLLTYIQYNGCMRNKLLLLLVFHVGWGVMLALSISKYGLGVSTDATSYMFTGINWINGDGLIDYSGSRYILWPPLYPMVIGFLHFIGLSAFVAAHVIQFTTFALIAYFSSVLFLKIFPDDFAFAFLGAFLIATGSVVVNTFYMVGTDYLFMLFPIILAFLIQKYSEEQTWSMLTLIGLLAALAMLTRYIGYSLVLTTGLVIFFYSTGSFFKRILQTIYATLFSLSPLLWMLQTWEATNNSRRDPLTFGEYASQYTFGVMSWFTFNLPDAKDITTLHYLIVWGSIAVAVFLLILLSRQVFVLNPSITFMLAFGGIYTIALFANALISYFNRLWGRFQLPIYFPLVLLFLVLISYGLRYLKENHKRIYIPAKILGVLFLLFTSISQINNTMILMREAVQGIIDENSINTQAVNENSIIQYWKKNPPQDDFHLFANYTALVAFHTQYQTDASPRKSGVYDENIIPLENYIDDLFAKHQIVYLMWIEPNNFEHVYLPYELTPIAEIEVVIENEDGGLYRLRPLK